MDTVNVWVQVRTMASRLYGTPVLYNMHYLCDVNNALSSGAWYCFSSRSFDGFL